MTDISSGIVRPRSIAERLRERFDTLTKIHRFRVGDLVCWKPGMRHLNNPGEGTPAIVVEALASPFVNNVADPYSPYFGDVLDLRVGVIGEHDMFLIYLVPSERLEPFKG